MKRRISVFALPAAAGAAFLVLATTAFAGTTQISGSFANGECGPTHSVPVGGPSRIEVSVSTTSASGLVYTQILDPAGNNASSSGSYDTPGRRQLRRARLLVRKRPGPSADAVQRSHRHRPGGPTGASSLQRRGCTCAGIAAAFGKGARSGPHAFGPCLDHHACKRQRLGAGSHR